MSRACIQLEEMTQKKLAKQLAFQCAPLLVGIKVSNIFIVSIEDEEHVKALFKESRISYDILLKCEKRIVFFLYHKKQLQKYLLESKQQQLMKQLGYEESSLEEILKQVASRYQCYMSFKQQFPHELGILLGYPHEDVKAFIKNEGKDCLCTGYWKVYSNVNHAKKIFESYDQAKQMVLQMVANGMDIKEIVEKYHDKKQRPLAV